MAETINFEQAVLENLRQLPTEKQEEVLDFVQLLVQKAELKNQLPSESSEYNSLPTTQPALNRPLAKYFCAIMESLANFII